LTLIGPKGLEFAKYSIEYHYLRNFIHVSRHWDKDSAEKHVPDFVHKIVEKYDARGVISSRAAMPAPFPGKK
jgi:7-hydroxymethyl chlorophyll a reductase